MRDDGGGLLTVKQSADYLAVSPWTVRKLVRSGQLELIQVSERRVGIRRSDLRALTGEPTPR